MTGDGGTGGRCFRDLPEEILGLIYRHCSSSYDRARFAVVCRSWRAASSWQPKLPAMPLLLPSTGNSCLDRKARAYSPEDGRVLRSRLPWFPNGKQIVGSYDGGWVAAASGSQVWIVNLFTRTWVVTKERIACRCPNAARQSSGEISIEKIVFSMDPTSRGCILVAMTTKCTIALCRLGFPGGRWTTWGCGGRSFLDIVFCNGDLYGLSSSHKLYKLGIGINEYHAPILISLMELTTIQIPNMIEQKYIFELRGKLATAVKFSSVGSSKAQIFKVFELGSSNTTDTYMYKWAEVTSLDDYALFLGPGCCKAVAVSAARKRGEMEGNRIYYSKHLDDEEDSECLARLDLGSCALYCYESKQGLHSEGIMSRGFHYRKKDDGISRNSCTWILPPRF